MIYSYETVKRKKKKLKWFELCVYCDIRLNAYIAYQGGDKNQVLLILCNAN